MDSLGDFLYKILVIGDADVGKTNLISQYTTNSLREEIKATIGVEFGHKAVLIGDKLIKAQIWDTAGQERFKALTRGYYRGAAGCLLVYSVIDRQSFLNVEKWIDELVQYADPGILVLLVGNKIDLASQRQVPLHTAKEFAQKNKLSFIETSAKDKTNVDEAFERILTEIYNQRKEQLDQTSTIEDSDIPPKDIKDVIVVTPKPSETKKTDCKC
eukprot:TRINITY_DN1836_c0_g2_i1.p1 TRINITY_DN1836_c0_g2~~TRINITY_DN1836_c0_g2_i1.p1  ORF type:complete len:214 (+),score=38.30 TRINITY_DN1836_c0_g2_i1:68-709(+)